MTNQNMKIEHQLNSILVKMKATQDKLDFLMDEYMRLHREYQELDAERHNAIMRWPDGSEFD